MCEDLIIQTIIGNITDDNQKLYKLTIKNDFSFRKLYETINILDDENDTKQEEEFEYNEEEQIDYLDNKLNRLNISYGHNRKDINIKDCLIRCPICKKAGHSEYDCYYRQNHTNQYPNRP
ncbi:hypothetical protein EDEG_04166 [Edhazardia aedis USNM 41457]|uniref:Uncharacterized protein n=1 Tax=Edhazardia aedis (strain USNM 41457) TaxID=1003232 RepID=J9DQS7_EDHAE|nr:hypothetical protein EDEG_04166 [Edhazardia aedis USNM 41457]|eukprot:EJW04920.1 hypothetical protein EDEG_04166 [Edhazardia aedis USNM 41457]